MFATSNSNQTMAGAGCWILVLLLGNGLVATKGEEFATGQVLNSTLVPSEPPTTNALRCICQSEIENNCYHDECYASYTCFSSVTNKNGILITDKGCFNEESTAKMMCKIISNEAVKIQCCDTPLCNKDLNPDISKVKDGEDKEGVGIAVPVLVPIAVIVPIAIMVFWCVWKKHRKKMQELDVPQKRYGHYEGGLHVEAVGESTLMGMMTSPCSSGSGSGQPVLVNTTVAKQIALIECIGKGRYGEVWRGMWMGESVAVKIFSSRDEQSFHRETEIYNTVMLRHNNILGYIASDMTSRNSCTQLWLICYYHPLGSLYEYLQRTTLDTRLMLQLCLTAANGLTHLHTEITGVKGKPPIAHRDIKSKNILVKADFTCCIADLGLAVLRKDNEIDIKKNNNRVGTKRYMAPEVLDESINVGNFDSFKQADVYAFGLVLWEISRRCRVGGIAEDYKPPFYDVVGHDPSFEEMRRIVCDDNYRPVILNRWHSDDTMCILAKMMKEMWAKNATSRLTMLRVKKTMLKAIEQLDLKEDKKQLDYEDKDLLIPRSDKTEESAYSTNLLKNSKNEDDFI